MSDKNTDLRSIITDNFTGYIGDQENHGKAPFIKLFLMKSEDNITRLAVDRMETEIHAVIEKVTHQRMDAEELVKSKTIP